MLLLKYQIIFDLILTNYRYQYDWKLEEAKKNILRTHTTAVSSRMLYKLAKQVTDDAVFKWHHLYYS